MTDKPAAKRFQIQYLRNGNLINGRIHPNRKDACEEAIRVWQAQAFDGYQLKELTP